MKAVIMSKDRPQVEIIWNPEVFRSEKITPLTNDFDIKVPRALRTSNGTLLDFFEFLETRCPPRDRIDIDRILRRYDLPSYSALGMCLKSYGRSPCDFLWIDFNDSGLHWDDIKIRGD